MEFFLSSETASSTPAGAFTLPIALPEGHVGATIDGDGDGDADAIVLSDRAGGHVALVLAGGNPTGLMDPGLAGGPVATIDFDGDGKPDGQVVNTGGGLVVVAQAPPAPTADAFTLPIFLPEGHVGATIDSDGDGDADAIVLSDRAGGHVALVLAGGNPTGFMDPGPAGGPVATIDFDGDGKPDGQVVNTGGGLVVSEFAFPVDSGPAFEGFTPAPAEAPPLPYDGGDFVIMPFLGSYFELDPFALRASDTWSA